MDLPQPFGPIIAVNIRNVLVALSELPKLQKEIFQYRFKTTDQFLAGHAIGNLIISALSEMQGDIFDAVQELSEMMEIRGHVFPVSDEPLTLNAEFMDGSTISGESEITKGRTYPINTTRIAMYLRTCQHWIPQSFGIWY